MGGFFARVASNKRVIARHGWNPLNRGLRRHPEVLKTKLIETTRTTSSTPSSPRRLPTNVPAGAPGHTTAISDMANTVSSSDKSLPKSLNLTSGYAGDFVTGMLQYANNNENNAGNLTKRYKDGRTLKESISQQENK
jgi:hypothetical protein